MHNYLLTAFGKDRIGIVKSVTEILYRFNLNIDDSAMIKLNDEFTIMLILEDNNHLNLEELKKEFKKIESEMRLNIFIKQIQKTKRSKDKNNIYNIIAYGQDKIGIIYKISKILTENNINIINLFTEKEDSFYVVIIRVEITKNFNIEILKDSLNKLKQELNLEIKIQEELKEIEM